MTMQGLWLENQQLVFRDDLNIPVPEPDEALVRVRLAGICSTDLELIKGYYPFTGIPGHEFVGEIIHAPSAPERVGERVVGEINTYCGHCQNCQNNRRKHCSQRTVLGIKQRNGAFAEYLCLPFSNLLAIPDNIDDKQAVFTEPLAAALEIQEQVAVHPSSKVLVIGAGRLGQLIAQTLRLSGCQLTVVVRHHRQQVLLDMNNIQWINEHQVDQNNFDLVVEASGSASGFNLAQAAVRPCGTIILKSTYQGMASIDLSSIVVNEIQLIGSRCGPFLPALQLLSDQLVNPAPLIDDCVPLNAATECFTRIKASGGMKFLITTLRHNTR